MKNVVSHIVVGVFLTFNLYGQQSQTELTMTANQFSVALSTQAHTGSTLLPLIEGKLQSGKKERFGILYRSNQAKATFAEILDENGSVLKSITVEEFIGKNTTQGVKLLKNFITGSGRVEEMDHEIKISSGIIHLMTDALLAGNANDAKNPEYIVMTYSLSSGQTQKLSLRFMFPVDGNADVKNSGIVLTGKSAAAAIGMSIIPKGSSVTYQKNTITITSPTTEVSSKTPVVWMTIYGETANSLALAKTLSAQRIENDQKNLDDAKLIVINTTSKADAQPGDTVMYSVVCKNVGLGNASNVVLSNDVPAGTIYLDGTVSEEGATVNFEKSQSQTGTESVKKIQWTLNDPLKGGSQVSVNFKVIIQ